MNNDELAAALGMHANAAVRGYERAVICEARRRDMLLTGEPRHHNLAPPAPVAMQLAVDPIDIHLTLASPPAVLAWVPATGWWLTRAHSHPRIAYYIGPGARPLQLVPTHDNLLRWVLAVLTGITAGHPRPARAVHLDDDPAAIRRLLDYARPLPTPVSSHTGARP